MKGKIPFLNAMPADAWDALLKQGLPRHSVKGQTIFLRGDPGDSILVLRAGIGEISITSQGGRKSTPNHMGAGEILGEIAPFDQGPRSGDAAALREGEAVSLTRAMLMAQFIANPAVLFRTIGALCDKGRNASDVLETCATIGPPPPRYRRWQGGTGRRPAGAARGETPEELDAAEALDAVGPERGIEGRVRDAGRAGDALAAADDLAHRQVEAAPGVLVEHACAASVGAAARNTLNPAFSALA